MFTGLLHRLKRLPVDFNYDNFQKDADEKMKSVTRHCAVTVAFSPAAPSEVLGFSVADIMTNELVWCYTKSLYRRNGIATACIPAWATLYASVPYTPGLKLFQKRNMQFNPFSNWRFI